MPYMLSNERIARTEGLLESIEVCLELKFGTEGLQLLPEIKQITDVELLQTVLRAIKTAPNLGELRRVWAQ